MSSEIFETHAHTTGDGVLNLSVNIGMADTDVSVLVHVKPLARNGDLDANGWPKGFFERVAGSMPELCRAPQGEFEKRPSLE